MWWWGALGGKASVFAPSPGLREVSWEGECDLSGLQPPAGMLSPGVRGWSLLASWKLPFEQE